MKQSKQVTYTEMTHLRAKGVSSHIKFRKVGPKRRIMLFSYPPTFQGQLVQLLMSSAVASVLHPDVFQHKFQDCLQVLHHMGMKNLATAYVHRFFERALAYTIPSICTGVSFLIDFFGIDSKNSALKLTLSKLNGLGLTQTFIRTFLSDDRTLNLDLLLENVNFLESNWKTFWQYKSNTNCIFCDLNLKKLLPITTRRMAVRQMACCKSVCCRGCYNEFFRVNGTEPVTQCHRCQTFFCYYDEKVTFVKDGDQNVLHSAMLQNKIRASQNEWLSDKPDRHINPPHWAMYQPGTMTYGAMLTAGRINSPG